MVAEAVVKEKLKDEQQQREEEGEGEGQSKALSDVAVPEVHVEKSNILLLGPTGSGGSRMCIHYPMRSAWLIMPMSILAQCNRIS